LSVAVNGSDGGGDSGSLSSVFSSSFVFFVSLLSLSVFFLFCSSLLLSFFLFLFFSFPLFLFCSLALPLFSSILLFLLFFFPFFRSVHRLFFYVLFLFFPPLYL